MDVHAQSSGIETQRHQLLGRQSSPMCGVQADSSGFVVTCLNSRENSRLTGVLAGRNLREDGWDGLA